MKVLDKGYLEIVDVMGDDNAIADAARVSFGKGLLAPEEKVKNRGLIHRLMKNGHTMPFAHAVVKVKVKMPIFVARQWVRHWSLAQAWNEISGRYVDIAPDHYIPEAARMQAADAYAKARKNLPVSHPPNTQRAQELLRDSQTNTHQVETLLLDAGVPRELARSNTPLSRYTEVVITGSLKDWLWGFLRQRLDSHAQYEIRVYAEALKTELTALFPWTMAEFEDNVEQAHTFSGKEMDTLREVLKNVPLIELGFVDMRAKDAESYLRAIGRYDGF